MFVGISVDQLLWPVALRNKLPDAACRLFLFNYLPDLSQNMRLHQLQNMQSMYSGAPDNLLRVVNRHCIDSERVGRGGVEALSTDLHHHQKIMLCVSGCWNT